MFRDVARAFDDLADDRPHPAPREMRGSEKLIVVDVEQERRERRRHDPAQTLLRFADRNHRRRQIGLRDEHAIEFDFSAHAAGRAQLGAAACKAARAQIFVAGLDAEAAQLGEHAIRGAQ